MSDLIYVEHSDPEVKGTWVPRSAMRQLGGQGWSEATPPEDTVKRHVGEGNDLADTTELVYLTHPALTAGAWVPRSAVAQHTEAGWVETEQTQQKLTTQQEPGTFDPAAHNLQGDDGVLAYLESASPAERERVIALEAEGQKRATVLNWTAADNPNNEEE